MRLTTSYKMKLTGDFKALETSLAIYRQALTYLISIINDDWEALSQYEFINQKYNQIEKWVHSNKNNQARFGFDQQFPKLPSYLRRSAISKALGIVSSYRSNLAYWEEKPEGRTPKLQTIQFATGKFYNADLNASYNIGAWFFIRHLLKTVTVTQRLALEAKVPQVAKRSTCTLSDLINLRSALAVIIAKKQA